VTPEEKTAHANEAERFAKHQIIEDVLSEFALNMHFERKGLPEYGLKKIVYHTAQVVLARARGFEPDLLLLTDEEAHEKQMRMADAILAAGKPVVITDGNMVASIDPEQDR
jgi:hypothetical protein